MTPLDQEARRLVGASAKRVSIVTTVSSRAAIDMLFVLGTALGLVRRLSFPLRSTTGCARPFSLNAARGFTSGDDWRTGGERQPASTDARPRHSSQIVSAPWRGLAQRPPYRAIGPRRHRCHPTAAVCRHVPSHTPRSDERRSARIRRRRRSAAFARLRPGYSWTNRIMTKAIG